MRTSLILFPLLATSFLYAQTSPVVIQPQDAVSGSRAVINSNFSQLYGQVSNVAGQLANLAPGVSSAAYNFTPQSPSPPQTLAPGSNTILLRPVPLGVNGSDTAHYLYVSGGTGAAEACLIAGGTAVSGAASGTVVVTCSGAHSGAWTIQSAAAGIPEAILGGVAGGGTVSVPAGTFPVYATITVARPLGVCIQGASTLSTFLAWAGPSSGDIIDFSGPLTAGGFGQGHCLRDIQINVSGSNTNTGVHVDNQGAFLADTVNIVGVSQSISVTGALSQRNNFQNLQLFGVTGDAVRLNTGLVGGRFDNIFISCTDAGLASNGFHILADQGTNIANSYTVGCANGFLAAPLSGSELKAITLTNVYFDCGPNVGIAINPAAGALVHILNFTGTTTACQAASGVLIGSTGTVAGIAFSGHTSIINGQFGYRLFGGTDISFTDSFAIGNSTSSSGVFDGLTMDGAATNVQVIGGYYGGYFGTANTQRYGISITGSVVNPQVQGAQLATNLTAALNDQSTSTFKTITGNPGIGVVTAASTAALDPTANDPLVVSLTGTTNVTSILRPWDLRSLAFVKGDSGSLTVLGVSLAQGREVSCVYSAGLTGWFCH